MEENRSKHIEKRVKKLIAQQMGIETSDIDLENSLTEELRMTVVDLGDLYKKLEEEGFWVSNIDILDIETVEELIEAIKSEELI